MIFIRSKDDKNLTLTDKKKYSGGTIENPPLIIYNVTRDDMGEYTCWLKNEVGLEQSEDSIYLNVQCKFFLQFIICYYTVLDCCFDDEIFFLSSCNHLGGIEV